MKRFSRKMMTCMAVGDHSWPQRLQTYTYRHIPVVVAARKWPKVIGLCSLRLVAVGHSLPYMTTDICPSVAACCCWPLLTAVGRSWPQLVVAQDLYFRSRGSWPQNSRALATMDMNHRMRLDGRVLRTNKRDEQSKPPAVLPFHSSAFVVM
jgi:hypothetical protein